VTRPCVLVVTGIVAVAVTGCGENDGSPEDTVNTFVGAIAEGDGEEACAQLTDADQPFTLPGRERFASDVPCEEKIIRFFGEAGDRVADASVEVTEESESDATVEVTASDGLPAASLGLVKNGDDWKINFLYVNRTRT
jgi:hypothetical protein